MVSSFRRPVAGSRTKVRCPRCRRINDGHIATQPGQEPRDGDVSICWHCHAVNIFGTNTRGVVELRIPTQTEWAGLQRDPAVKRARVAILETNTVAEAAALYTHMSAMDTPVGDPPDGIA
jgi:hypothetical protein